jgi:hypothetical protein
VLNEYIEHDNLQVRTYINGTLYSLLSRATLKEQARALGMPELLKDLLNHSEGQLTRQVRYIIDQLEAEQVDDGASDDNEDALGYDDDEDYETENEDEVDADIVNAGIPIGESLLQEYFVHVGGVPSMINDNGASGLSKSEHTRLSSSNSVNRNLPSAMKSRPRIPRTPINDELLGIVKRENESILANANHIKRNEEANRKKMKQSPQKDQSPPKEEAKEELSPAKEEVKATEVPEIKEAPSIKVEEKQEPEDPKRQEFTYAFKTREKIVRTPPEQERSYNARGYLYGQYYKDQI